MSTQSSAGTTAPVQRPDALADALAIASATFFLTRGAAGRTWADEAMHVVAASPAGRRRRRRFPRWLVALAVLVASAALPGRAAAAVPETCAGPGLPIDQTSIQLFNFYGYVMGDKLNATTRVQQARTDEVLRRVHGLGFRNVEPASFERRFNSGGYDATGLRRKLDQYGLAALSAHVNLAPATFDQTLADARALGLRWTGSGQWPGLDGNGFSSYQEVRDVASALNALGERSVRNRTGKVFGHNHSEEFATRFPDPVTGERKTVWEILVELTDPRYVTFQLDVLWAADAGEDPAELLTLHGDRIALLHLKDGTGISAPEPASPVALGSGELDLPGILDAAVGKVDLYVYEQDPPFGDPSYDPFAEAALSLRYLRCVAF